MIDEEICYNAKLNVILKKNCEIIRKDYSFAKKYEKCLIEIEHAESIIIIQKCEKKNLISKLKTYSNSINALSQLINETDSEIGRVKREIELLAEKTGRVCNECMTMSCSLSNDDELKLLQRQLALVLLTTLKYSNEIRTAERGFDTPNNTDVKHFDDGQWSQFRMEWNE